MVLGQSTDAMQETNDDMIYHETDLTMRRHGASIKLGRIASKRHEDAAETTRGNLLGDNQQQNDTCLTIQQEDDIATPPESRSEARMRGKSQMQMTSNFAAFLKPLLTNSETESPIIASSGMILI
jgi:hypothetical protein